MVPSSCLEGLGALGTGQTGELPWAVTALTCWHSSLLEGLSAESSWCPAR